MTNDPALRSCWAPSKYERSHRTRAPLLRSGELRVPPILGEKVKSEMGRVKKAKAGNSLMTND